MYSARVYRYSECLTNGAVIAVTRASFVLTDGSSVRRADQVRLRTDQFVAPTRPSAATVLHRGRTAACRVRGHAVRMAESAALYAGWQSARPRSTCSYTVAVPGTRTRSAICLPAARPFSPPRFVAYGHRSGGCRRQRSCRAPLSRGTRAQLQQGNPGCALTSDYPIGVLAPDDAAEFIAQVIRVTLYARADDPNGESARYQRQRSSSADAVQRSRSATDVLVRQHALHQAIAVVPSDRGPLGYEQLDRHVDDLAGAPIDLGLSQRTWP